MSKKKVEVTEEEKFASTEAIALAEKSGLKAGDIEALGVKPTGAEGEFTKEDVEKAVELNDDDFGDVPAKKPAGKTKGETYTYVGGGASSPRKIMFMGRQEFVRGKETEVSDPTVLAKVANNPAFAKGKVKDEVLDEIDEAGDKAEKEQQAVNKELDASFKKKHG